jgi:hypothetical protein
MKPELELVCEVHATLDPVIDLGVTPEGQRRVVPITGGRFEGPALRGTVLPGGADWQLVRADAVTVPDALYLLRTDDGVVIQVHNKGLRHGLPEVIKRLSAGAAVDPGEYYFRAVPTFAAPLGKYQWLNNFIFISTGARYSDHIKLWFYRVT